MIDREKINNIPSSVKDAIVSYMERELSTESKVKEECTSMYMTTLEEKYRATALRAEGRISAFEELIKVFNKV